MRLLKTALKKTSFQKTFLKYQTRNISLLSDPVGLSEDQVTIMDSSFNFSKNEFLPYAPEWDLKKHFPKDIYRKAAELGFGGIYVDEKYGGSGLGRLEASLIFEGLATGCVGSSAYLSIANMCAWIVDKYGSEEQKENWLSKMCSLEYFSSYCLTEPGSGSDSKNMKTTAKVSGSDFILNGSKAFISGGEHSNIYLVMCKTAENEVSCIAVERDSKGLSFGKNENKMGWNVQPTQMVIFEDCIVPQKNLIGNKGDGFKIAMSGLDGGRVNIASCSIGGAAFAFETAKEYMKVRKQFGKSLADFQYLQFRLAEMAIDLQASRLMVRHAARLLDENNENKTTAAAMAKSFATNKCFDVVNYALQIHGGYGYLKDYPIERILRDLRVHLILEGTDEIMKLIISKNLFKD